MRRVRQAVIQSRVYLRHPGLLRASLANLPVRESTCRIYLPRDTPKKSLDIENFLCCLAGLGAQILIAKGNRCVVDAETLN
jgi:hypothetical protein